MFEPTPRTVDEHPAWRSETHEMFARESAGSGVTEQPALDQPRHALVALARHVEIACDGLLAGLSSTRTMSSTRNGA